MAEEITLARFRELYPEFDSPVSEDAEAEYALELAQEIHRCSANAIYALAAHFLSLAITQGQGGDSPATGSVQQIKKSRVGRVATEFVQMAGSMEDSFYETTPYGKLFLALKNASLKKFVTKVF